MGQETERKFLVTGDGWQAQADEGQTTRQAYLAIDDDRQVRVRILDGETAKLTIKTGGASLSRAEFEYDIPLSDAKALMTRCVGKPIAKTRYRVPAGGGLTWEIDRFEDRHEGLVMAEIELDSEDAAFDRPDWLGREVTGDEAYYNAALAADGVSPSETGTSG